jgi:hypothetical protein
MQKQEFESIGDPQDSEYQMQFKLTSGVINPIAFPNLNVEVLKIISP